METKAVFVSATDTDVGKTVVTYLLARTLVEQGLKTAVMKPLASGVFEKTGSGELVIPDLDFLKTGFKDLSAVDIVCPLCFKASLAPYAAAILENKKVDLLQVYRCFSRLKKKAERVVVEGIGGMMVPLTKRTFVGDMVKKMNIPLLLVSRPNLGTLNHTLLTIHYARSLNIKIAGIILNYSEKATNSIAEKTNPQYLQELSGVPVLATVPYCSSLGKVKLNFASLDKLYRQCDFTAVVKKCF